MVELVLANNDSMAEGAISALQTAGWNLEGGDKVIPVYGVDAMASAVEKIDNGIMTGTVKQDGDAMAATIATLVKNVMDGADPVSYTHLQATDSPRRIRGSPRRSRARLRQSFCPGKEKARKDLFGPLRTF